MYDFSGHFVVNGRVGTAGFHTTNKARKQTCYKTTETGSKTIFNGF